MQNRTYHVNMQRAKCTMQCVQHAAYNTRHAWQCTAHSIQHSVHKVAAHYATTSDALPAARRLQVHAIAAGGRSDFMNPPDGARIIQVCPNPRPVPAWPLCGVRSCGAQPATRIAARRTRPCDRCVQLEALYVSVLQSLSAELHALHLTSLSNQSVIYAV